MNVKNRPPGGGNFSLYLFECGNRGEVFAITSKQGSAEKSALEHGASSRNRQENLNGLCRGLMPVPGVGLGVGLGLGVGPRARARAWLGGGLGPGLVART